jgi:hypothetical protein
MSRIKPLPLIVAAKRGSWQMPSIGEHNKIADAPQENPMLGTTKFFLINVALIGLALLLYCVRLLRRIDRATSAVRSLLFRDYEEDLSSRGTRPVLKPSTQASRGVANTRPH